VVTGGDSESNERFSKSGRIREHRSATIPEQHLQPMHGALLVGMEDDVADTSLGFVDTEQLARDAVPGASEHGQRGVAAVTHRTT
jgi:hypothetical protein